MVGPALAMGGRAAPITYAAVLAAALASACETRAPAGAPPAGSAVVGVVDAAPAVAEREADEPTASDDARLGTPQDNLPFDPDGTRVASIAWRTWVYTDTGSQRTRFGYLRAGAVVDARGPAITNEGCQGGWYRINPRGFVCVGKGAILGVDHPVVRAVSVRPERGAGLPYRYALASDPPPHRYFRLPTAAQIAEVEGEAATGRAELWLRRVELRGGRELLALRDEAPGAAARPAGAAPPPSVIAAPSADLGAVASADPGPMEPLAAPSPSGSPSAGSLEPAPGAPAGATGPLSDAARLGVPDGPVRRAPLLLSDLPGPPEFLLGEPRLPVPYGVHKDLAYAAHTGRAAYDAGFALQAIFAHEGRIWGLTTDLDLLPMDRTELVVPSTLRGRALGPGEDLPVAYVSHPEIPKFREVSGVMRHEGDVRRREFVLLSGESRGGSPKLWQTADGGWVSGEGVVVFPRRVDFPSVATGARKWIDISINRQTLVAYEGQKAVYATLVSTGRGRLGDPEKDHATVRGTFMIHSKHVTATMDGDEDRGDSYNLLDVPFVQYFHKGFALHGAYWHDEFGEVRSHGCVNLAPDDAAWLFEWTDPVVPPGWHSAINLERGTVVYVHP